jgi:hypothetical protein
LPLPCRALTAAALAAPPITALPARSSGTFALAIPFELLPFFDLLAEAPFAPELFARLFELEPFARFVEPEPFELFVEPELFERLVLVCAIVLSSLPTQDSLRMHGCPLFAGSNSMGAGLPGCS